MDSILLFFIQQKKKKAAEIPSLYHGLNYVKNGQEYQITSVNADGSIQTDENGNILEVKELATGNTVTKVNPLELTMTTPPTPDTLTTQQNALNAGTGAAGTAGTAAGSGSSMGGVTGIVSMAGTAVPLAQNLVSKNKKAVPPPVQSGAATPVTGSTVPMRNWFGADAPVATHITNLANAQTSLKDARDRLAQLQTPVPLDSSQIESDAINSVLEQELRLQQKVDLAADSMERAWGTDAWDSKLVTNLTVANQTHTDYVANREANIEDARIAETERQTTINAKLTAAIKSGQTQVDALAENASDMQNRLARAVADARVNSLFNSSAINPATGKTYQSEYKALFDGATTGPATPAQIHLALDHLQENGVKLDIKFGEDGRSIVDAKTNKVLIDGNGNAVLDPKSTTDLAHQINNEIKSNTTDMIARDVLEVPPEKILHQLTNEFNFNASERPEYQDYLANFDWLSGKQPLPPSEVLQEEFASATSPEAMRQRGQQISSQNNLKGKIDAYKQEDATGLAEPIDNKLVHSAQLKLGFETGAAAIAGLGYEKSIADFFNNGKFKLTLKGSLGAGASFAALVGTMNAMHRQITGWLAGGEGKLLTSLNELGKTKFFGPIFKGLHLGSVAKWATSGYGIAAIVAALTIYAIWKGRKKPEEKALEDFVADVSPMVSTSGPAVMLAAGSLAMMGLYTNPNLPVTQPIVTTEIQMAQMLSNASGTTIDPSQLYGAQFAQQTDANHPQQVLGYVTQAGVDKFNHKMAAFNPVELKPNMKFTANPGAGGYIPAFIKDQNGEIAKNSGGVQAFGCQEAMLRCANSTNPADAQKCAVVAAACDKSVTSR